MAKHDYYTLLGVPRNASPEEIKRAYRGLVMRYHPDRNPDDVDAEQRFKDVVEAHETLSDPERRARYDQMGPFYRSDGRVPTPEELTEVLGQTIGGLFRRERRQPAEDLRHDLQVSLYEVATGGDPLMEVPRQARCGRCGGDGADPEGGRKDCADCGGTGKSRTARFLRPACPRCDGKGWIMVKRCEQCGGEGRHGTVERLRVHIPPGVGSGQKLKIKGKGNAARSGSQVGDLLVIVKVADHPLFQRRGADLLMDLPITFAEAVAGAEITVPTLQGEASMRIPPATPTGKVFRLAGLGLPRLSGGLHGDLHIRVAVEVPTGLGSPEREAIRDLFRRVGPAHHPQRAAFEQAREDAARALDGARQATSSNRG